MRIRRSTDLSATDESREVMNSNWGLAIHIEIGGDRYHA